jgi:hypothetical protein
VRRARRWLLHSSCTTAYTAHNLWFQIPAQPGRRQLRDVRRLVVLDDCPVIVGRHRRGAEVAGKEGVQIARRDAHQVRIDRQDVLGGPDARHVRPRVDHAPHGAGAGNRGYAGLDSEVPRRGTGSAVTSTRAGGRYRPSMELEPRQSTPWVLSVINSREN